MFNQENQKRKFTEEQWSEIEKKAFEIKWERGNKCTDGVENNNIARKMVVNEFMEEAIEKLTENNIFNPTPKNVKKLKIFDEVIVQNRFFEAPENNNNNNHHNNNNHPWLFAHRARRVLDFTQEDNQKDNQKEINVSANFQHRY